MFVHHHDAITDSVLLDFLASGYIAMARIHDIRGRPNRAEDLLSDAEELAHTAGWPRLLRITAWERVRRALLAGETDRAQAIASRIPAQPEFLLPNGGMVFWEAVEGDAIGRIRLALHGGQEMAALASLAGEIASAKRHKLVFRLIKLLVLEALAQKRLGQAEAARQSLNQALLLGAEEGFARLFLDEGEMLLALLRSEQAALAREAPVLRDFMSSLLGDASGPGGITTGFQPLEPLTEREVEILGLLAKGLSNKEIALRTEVSENTIKFHLKNIYSKLAVNSRLQAVNATRQMALLR
jgi:LuxR family maltose regulon positive regulatory protein